MSSIRRTRRVRTETLSSYTQVEVNNCRVATEPSQVFQTIRSHSKHQSQLSANRQCNKSRMGGVLSFQEPHFIKIALASRFKEPSSRKQAKRSDTGNNNNKYELVRPISQGSAGVVFLGSSTESCKLAIKQVVSDRSKPNRELAILKCVKHPNIIRLKDYYFKGDEGRCLLHLVMDYFPTNLHTMIRQRQVQRKILPIILYQILSGLSYLHQKSIMHRDLTPHNILVDPNNHKVVIADLGSAKYANSQEQSISYVCARAYRAPELLFGSTSYSPQVDMWSFGCILVELVNSGPVFKGRTSVEQTLEVIMRLGAPSQSEMAAMNPHYSMHEFEILPKIKRKQWKDILNTKDGTLLDLIDKIMVYDPRKRLKPQEAMNHPFFDPIRDQRYLSQLGIEQSLFNYQNTASETKSINFSIESPQQSSRVSTRRFKIQQTTQSSMRSGLRRQLGNSSLLRRKLF